MDYSIFRTSIILLGAALALFVGLMQALLVKKEPLNYLIQMVCLNIIIFHLTSNFYVFDALPDWHTIYGYVRIYHHVLSGNHKSVQRKKSNLYASLLLAGFMLLSCAVYIDYYFGKGTFTLVMQSRMAIFIGLIFIASFRYPFVLNIIKLEAYREEYTNSRISGIDSDAVLKKLEAIMEQDKIFQHANLKVHRLAKILGIQIGRAHV